MAQKKSAVVKALEQLEKRRVKVVDAGEVVRLAFGDVDSNTGDDAKAIKQEMVRVLKLRSKLDKAATAAYELGGALTAYLQALTEQPK